MLTDEKIADLKSRYGDSLTAIDDLVFRKPKRADYERFITEVGKNQSNVVSAARVLIRSCLAHPESEGKPDIAALEAVLDARPGLLLSAILPAIHEMAGGAEGSAEVKKL